MSFPATSAALKEISELKNLTKELNFYAKGVKQIADAKAFKSQFTALKNGVTEVKNTTKVVAKDVAEGKKLWDNLLRKIPGGNNAQKAAKAGAGLATIALLAGLVFVMAAKVITDFQIQNIGFDNEIRNESEFQKAFQRYQRNVLDIRVTNKKIDAQNKIINRNNRDLDSLSRNYYGIKTIAEKAAKISNDSLYETRQGRKIVEQKINDTLYEVRTGWQKIEATINADIAAVKSSFSNLNSIFKSRLDTTINNLQVKTNFTIETLKQQLQGTKNDITNINQKLKLNTNNGIDPNTIAGKAADIVFNKVNSKLGQIDQKNIAQDTKIDAVGNGLSTLGGQLRSIDGRVSIVEKTPIKLPPQKNYDSDINDLKTRIGKQEKVNQDAIPKLDKLLTLIPLIPARVADNIRPSIPTKDDLINAAATGTCRTTQPGGCSRKMMDDAVSNIKSHNNQNTGSVLDAINTGANAALLQGQGEILSRLGSQIPGGIGRVVSQITRNQAINQIANLVTMAAAIHNTIQLSDNVAVTFFGILDNIFAIPSLILNPEGNPIDTHEVFSGAIENVMKSVFGVQEWAEIKAKWQSFNRIYQAGANSINEIRSVGASLNDAISTTATLTGRGFNALQNDGILSDYNWEPTPENLRLKGGIFGKMGKLADGINVVGETLEAIESVTSEIRSAVESANQIKQNTTEMEAEIQKLLGDETKKKDDAIAALQVTSFNYEDLL